MVQGNGAVSFEGCIISRNKAFGSTEKSSTTVRAEGGGIHLSGGGSAHFNQTSLLMNVAEIEGGNYDGPSVFGGGIFLSAITSVDTAFSFSACTIASNIARGSGAHDYLPVSGGGVYVSSGGGGSVSVAFSSTTISSNVADGESNMGNIDRSSATADVRGGGVYCASVDIAIVAFKNCDVIGNRVRSYAKGKHPTHAFAHGGGVYLSDVDLGHFEGTSVILNHLQLEGVYGIDRRTPGEFPLNDNRVGSGIYSNMVAMRLDSKTLFEGNNPQEKAIQLLGTSTLLASASVRFLGNQDVEGCSPETCELHVSTEGVHDASDFFLPASKCYSKTCMHCIDACWGCENATSLAPCTSCPRGSQFETAGDVSQANDVSPIAVGTCTVCSPGLSNPTVGSS